MKNNGVSTDRIRKFPARAYYLGRNASKREKICGNNLHYYMWELSM